MLRFRYHAVPSGAPDTYGTTADRLLVGDTPILDIRKSDPDAPSAPAQLAQAIETWLAGRTDPARPVYLMVHGYQFDPSSGETSNTNSPYGSVYGVPSATLPHNLSWLPLVGECDDSGNPLGDAAIAFAYTSIGSANDYSSAGWSNSYQHAVFDLSPLAARALATILDYLGRRPIRLRVLAHSLGTRTISQAMHLLRDRIPASVERVILLQGAEFCVDAQANLLGKGFDVSTVMNRDDQVLGHGGDTFCHPYRPNNSLEACVIGQEGLCDDPAWLDLPLDKEELQTWFAAANAPTGTAYTITGEATDGAHGGQILGHWVSYTDDGNRALVRDLLQDDRMTVAALRAAGVPRGTGRPSFGHFAGHAVPATLDTRAKREAMQIASIPGQNSNA